MGEIAYRVGKRDQLVAELIGAEREAGRRADEAWLDRFSGLNELGDADAAAIIGAYIDDVALNRRAAAIVWDEILIEASIDPKMRLLVIPWIHERAAFWQTLISGRHPHGSALARVVADYVVSEQLYSIVLGADPGYRMIRDACIRRLCGGMLRDPASRSPGLLDSLLDQYPRVTMPTTAMGARALVVARAAGRLMAERGLASVTHRAVASALDMTASAVAHHFRTRIELVRAAIEAIYETLHDRMNVSAIKDQLARDRAGLGELIDSRRTGVPLTRATYLIALHATRDASFIPLARQRRMERGRTSERWMGELFTAPERFDRCSAQIMSMVLGGTVITATASDEPYSGYFPAIIADLVAIAR